MVQVSLWAIVFVAVPASILGFLGGRILLRSHSGSDRRTLTAAQIEIARLTERASKVEPLEIELSKKAHQLQEETNVTAALKQQVAAKEDITARLTRAIDTINPKYDELLRENRNLSEQLARLKESLENEEERGIEREQLLTKAEERFSDTFKSLASEILEEKAKRLDGLNKEQLGNLLNPLQKELENFHNSVQTIHREQGMERTELSTQLEQLMKLNQGLSQDAQDLTLALKGSSKTQGNWGELILERVLESSGLQKGRDYDLRQTYDYEDGRRGQPDVVINLPEDRHLVIDAKVSLNSYDEHVKALDKSESELARKSHVDSVRRHIKELSAKNYQDLYGLNSLDFVVMFIPIEPAFASAIAGDPKLWEDAFRKNVLLVSPSGLLFVLRTVGVLWRQEYQARNVRDIARRGADLYNKLCGFVEELDVVGFRLQQARNSFDEARKKLCTGQGNVIRQAEMLKDLGIKPTKALPSDLADAAAEEQSPVPPLIALTQDVVGAGEHEAVVQDIAAVMADLINEDEIPF